MILKLLLSFLALLKIVFLLQIFDSFAIMVTTLYLTILKILPLLTILVISVIYFTTQLLILNNQVSPSDPSDYPSVNPPIRHVLSTLRTSLGDFQPPDYSLWLSTPYNQARI